MNIATLNIDMELLSDFLKISEADFLPFNSIEKLLLEEKKFAIFLAISSYADLTLIMSKIRQSNNNYLTPVFNLKKIDNFELTDGHLSTKDAFLEKAERINNYIKKINLANYRHWNNKFLAFFYTRQPQTLLPTKNNLNPFYIHYPILDLFNTHEENNFFWLNDMVNENILKKETLIDQLYQCPFCYSAHLKFSEHCENCNSIDLKNEKFLHCFSCGLVAPENDFLKSGKLICSKCNARLKHIGEDYDLPLESGQCKSCGHQFTDSKLIASCMYCNKNSETSSLFKRYIYEYSLTEKGINYTLLNFDFFGSVFTDSINYVNNDFFYSMLQWFIEMNKRYENEIFSLIGLSVHAENGMDNNAFYELAKRIREMLRTTDFCTKLENSTIWIIFPKVDKIGLSIISQRINDAGAHIKSLFKSEPTIKIATYLSSHEKVKNETAKLLIAKLNF